MRPDVMRLLLVVLSLALAACGAAPSRQETPVRDHSAPTAAEINVSLGQGYLEKGDLELALEKLQKALQLDPRLPEAHTVIAVVYERIRNDDRAEFHYKRATELGPKNGAVLNNYGTYLCRRGKYEEADAYFVRALADPFYQTPAAAYGNRGACAIQWGKLDLGEEQLRKALALDPNLPMALYDLASVLFRRGDYFRARAFVQRYEALAPANPEQLQLALMIEEKLGNARAAREYRSRLQSEFPDSEQAHQISDSESGK